MILYETIQSELAAAIQAHPYVGELPVIVDDGLAAPQIDAVLNTGGVCIIVGLPLAVGITTQSKKAASGDVRVVVIVHVNPDRNASTDVESPGAQRDILKLVRAIVQGGLSADREDIGDRFFRLVDGENMQLSFREDGTITYNIFFERKIAIGTAFNPDEWVEAIP